MGNYLTIGAKFKPYSFDEMIRPYQMYGQAYKELEAGLEDLATKSSIWEGLTDENRDKETHAQYSKYANDLQAQAAQLAKEGLNATNRLALSKLKLRYGAEIVPIELAYAKRQQILELDKKLRELAMLSGSALYSDRPDLLNISLDEIRKNPNLAPAYETLAARIANAAKIALTIAKQENGQSKWETTAGGQMIERKTSTGLTQKELIDAANGQSTPRVEALINQAMSTLGSSNWSNVDKSLLRNDVIQGLYAGIGETKDELQRNANFISAESTRNYNLNREQFEWLKAKDIEQARLVQEKLDGAGGSGSKSSTSAFLKGRTALAESPTRKPYEEVKLTLSRKVIDPVTKTVYNPINATRTIKSFDSQLAQLEKALEQLKKLYGVNWAGQAAYNPKFDTKKSRAEGSVVRLIDLSKDLAIQSATKEYNDKAAQIKLNMSVIKSNKADLLDRLGDIILSDKEYQNILNTTGTTERDGYNTILANFDKVNTNLLFRTTFYDYNDETEAGRKVKLNIEGYLSSNIIPLVRLGKSGTGNIYEIDDKLNVDKSKPVKLNQFAGLLELTDDKGSVTKASQILNISLNPQIMKQMDSPYVVIQDKKGKMYAVDASLINDSFYNQLKNGWKETVQSFGSNDIETAASLTNQLKVNSSMVF